MSEVNFKDLHATLESNADKTPLETKMWKFLNKITVYDSPCWIWRAKTHGGYGYFRTLRGAHVVAHKFIYEFLYGPVPRGMQLDHLCNLRRCVNPSHLKLVTPRENVMRSLGLAALNYNKTHCKYGHPLFGDNLKIVAGGNGRPCRHCKTCCARRSKEYELRRPKRTWSKKLSK